MTDERKDQAFDPYNDWLGIPPQEQPPNHYRLLGLKVFENDLEVIRNAGNQHADHLRTLQIGKHSTLSQQLLTEVAEALACLLDPAKKVAYDRELRKCVGTATEGAETHSGVRGGKWLALAIVWGVLVLAGALVLSEWAVSRGLARLNEKEESRARETCVALEEMSASVVELHSVVDATLANLTEGCRVDEVGVVAFTVPADVEIGYARVEFKRVLSGELIVLTGETGSSGTFLLTKSEAIKPTGCTIAVQQNNGKAFGAPYKARIGYVVIRSHGKAQSD